MPDRIPEVFLTNNNHYFLPITKLELFTHSWTTKTKTIFCHTQSLSILTFHCYRGIQHQYFSHLTTTGVGAASAGSLMRIMSLMIILINDPCCSPAQAHPGVPRPVHGSCLGLSVLQNFRCPIRGIFISCLSRKETMRQIWFIYSSPGPILWGKCIFQVQTIRQLHQWNLNSASGSSLGGGVVLFSFCWYLEFHHHLIRRRDKKKNVHKTLTKPKAVYCPFLHHTFSWHKHSNRGTWNLNNKKKNTQF